MNIKNEMNKCDWCGQDTISIVVLSVTGTELCEDCWNQRVNQRLKDLGLIKREDNPESHPSQPLEKGEKK